MIIIASALAQACLGILTWGPTRIGMDIIMEKGDTTSMGYAELDDAMRKFMGINNNTNKMYN